MHNAHPFVQEKGISDVSSATILAIVLVPLSVPGFLFASPNYQLSVPLSPILVSSFFVCCQNQSGDLRCVKINSFLKRCFHGFLCRPEKQEGIRQYRIMYKLNKFCLRRHDFKENLASAFWELRDGHDFSDVTLACDDGTILEAHKFAGLILDKYETVLCW